MDVSEVIAHLDRRFGEVRGDLRSLAASQEETARRMGGLTERLNTHDNRLASLEKRDSKGLTWATALATVISSVVAGLAGQWGRSQ